MLLIIAIYFLRNSHFKFRNKYGNRLLSSFIVYIERDYRDLFIDIIICIFLTAMKEILPRALELNP